MVGAQREQPEVLTLQIISFETTSTSRVNTPFYGVESHHEAGFRADAHSDRLALQHSLQMFNPLPLGSSGLFSHMKNVIYVTSMPPRQSSKSKKMWIFAIGGVGGMMSPLLRAAINLSQKQAALNDEINLAFGVAVFIFLVFGGVVAIVQVKSDLREALFVGMSLPSLLTIANKELSEVRRKSEDKSAISNPGSSSSFFGRSIYAASPIKRTRKLSVSTPPGICSDRLMVESSGYSSEFSVNRPADIPASASSLRVTCEEARSETVSVTPGSVSLSITFLAERDPWYGFYFGLGIKSRQYILRVSRVELAKDVIEGPSPVTHPVTLKGTPEEGSLALHPNGNAIAWAAKDSRHLELWKIEESKISNLTKTRTIWTHPGLLTVGFSRDGRSVYGATDRSLVEWNAETGEPKRFRISSCAGGWLLTASIRQSALATWHYGDGVTCFLRIPSTDSALDSRVNAGRVTSKFSSVSMEATIGDELYIVDETRTAVEVMNLKNRTRVRELRVPKNLGSLLDIQVGDAVRFLIRRKDEGVSICEGEAFKCLEAPVGRFRFGRLAPDGAVIALWGGLTILA